jgi:hypothetical protein
MSPARRRDRQAVRALGVLAVLAAPKMRTITKRGVLTACTLAATVSLGGCAAIGLTAVSIAGTVLGAGAGAVVQAGTQYSLTGVVYRTFSVPKPDLYEAATSTLKRLKMDIEEAEASDDDLRVVATAANKRTVTIELEEITPVMTRLRVAVSRGWLFKDVTTGSELVTQIAADLDKRAIDHRYE